MIAAFIRVQLTRSDRNANPFVSPRITDVSLFRQGTDSLTRALGMSVPSVIAHNEALEEHGVEAEVYKRKKPQPTPLRPNRGRVAPSGQASFSEEEASLTEGITAACSAMQKKY